MDDYHYGELESRQAAELAEHLRSCSGCQRELEMIKREAGLYDAYAAKTQDGIDLPDDLWQRALAKAAAAATPAPQATRSSGSASWFSFLIPASPWVRQAIAALFLVAVSVGGTLLFVNHYRNDQKAVFQRNTDSGATGDKRLEAALQSIQRAEQEYLNAIRDLSAIVEKQKSTLDPRVVVELQKSLGLIDDYIAATRKAYYAHPEDAELALFMLAAYGRKVELLQDLAAS
jgi:hypothetical protein